MIEVTQADLATADAIVAVQFDNSHAGYHADIAAIVAAHRQQAENEMRERCAKVADDYAGAASKQRLIATIDGNDETGEWYWAGRRKGAADVATAIRATPPKPDRLNGEGA